MINSVVYTDHPDIAQSLDNMGSVHNQFGELDKALYYYTESLEMKKRIFSISSIHAEISAALNHIGLVHFKMNQFDLALEFFSESLQIRKQNSVNGSEDCTIAQSLNNLGLVCEKQVNLEAALEFVQHEMLIRSVICQTKGEHKLELAESLTNMASVYFKMGGSRASTANVLDVVGDI